MQTVQLLQSKKTVRLYGSWASFFTQRCHQMMPCYSMKSMCSAWIFCLNYLSHIAAELGSSINWTLNREYCYATGLVLRTAFVPCQLRVTEREMSKSAACHIAFVRFYLILQYFDILIFVCSAITWSAPQSASFCSWHFNRRSTSQQQMLHVSWLCSFSMGKHYRAVCSCWPVYLL